MECDALRCFPECHNASFLLRILQGHEVYLSPVVTAACCLIVETAGRSQLALGGRGDKRAQLQMLRAVLSQATGPRPFWYVDTSVRCFFTRVCGL